MITNIVRVAVVRVGSRYLITVSKFHLVAFPVSSALQQVVSRWAVLWGHGCDVRGAEEDVARSLVVHHTEILNIRGAGDGVLPTRFRSLCLLLPCPGVGWCYGLVASTEQRQHWGGKGQLDDCCYIRLKGSIMMRRVRGEKVANRREVLRWKWVTLKLW